MFILSNHKSKILVISILAISISLLEATESELISNVFSHFLSGIESAEKRK